MKTRSPMKKLAALVVAASALVGCSVNSPLAAKQPALPSDDALLTPHYQVLVEADTVKAKHHKKKASEFMAKLALTDAQKTQLKAVMKEALDKAIALQKSKASLLTGAEIDPKALMAGIEDAIKQDAIQDAQTMEAVKQVLDDAQRTLVADKLMEMASKQDDPHTKLFDKLMDKVGKQITMTAEQKAAFDTLKTDFKDFWLENRAAYYQAMAAHMKSGSQADLQAAFERLGQNLPADSMVAFLSTLDQDQRQALVAWKEKLMARIAAKLNK